jgi:Cu/Ag efflux protein CusF
MRLWKVVVLVDLALVLGLGIGYLWWGRSAAQLRSDLAAARAAQGAGVERDFRGEGVVRAILPEIGVVVITHGDIPGYMPPMTMGFRAAPGILDSTTIGDTVRFVLRGVPPNVTLVGIQKSGT